MLTRMTPVLFFKGFFKFSLLLTRAGPVSIFAGLAYPGGLSATYYTDDSFSAPADTSLDSEIDFSSPPWPGKSVPEASAGSLFSVLWSGYVMPDFAQVYTFSFVLLDSGGSNIGGSCAGRVALWIDNAVVVSQWNSLASVEPTGTFLLTRADSLSAIDIRYKAPASSFAAGGPGSLRLYWQTDWRGQSVQQEVVPPGSLYWAVAAGGKPDSASVLAAAATIGTASLEGSYSGQLYASDSDGGASATFNASLTMRDPFGNPALPPPANILAVRVQSVATLAQTQPLLVYAGGSTFQMSYTLMPASIYARAIFIMQAAARGGLNAEYFDDGRLLDRVMTS